MSFSQFAGTAIVPTLSRLVLALAFTTVGWNKLTTTSPFSAVDAKVLQDLGVQVEPRGTAAAHPVVVPAAFVQDVDDDTPPPQDAEAKPGAQPGTKDGAQPGTKDGTKDAAEPAGGPAAGAKQPVIPAGKAGPQADSPAETPADSDASADVEPAASPAGDDKPFQAKSLHQITLMCHRKGWPSPTSLAWAAALTELIGGVLLLVGFLSRLWGLGLAITMGVAFYMVSMGYYQVHTEWPWVYAREIPQYNTTFNQIGLFVLAFGVLLTGPGPLSVDRILFRRTRSGERGILKPEDPPTAATGRPM